APAGGAGMPVVDRGVELHSGVGAAPGGVADLLPELGGPDALADLAVRAVDQLPHAVCFRGFEEAVGEADRVVAVLAADCAVGLAFEGGIEAALATGHQCCDLVLLMDLPVDELLDVRVVNIEADHLGSAARGATGLDRT